MGAKSAPHQQDPVVKTAKLAVGHAIGEMPKMPPRENRLHTVDRALRVLTSFPSDGQDVSLRELSAAVGIESSVVYRILYTLAEHGVVTKNPSTRRYALGPRLLELASRGPHLDLRRKALPAMERLARETGESALLLVCSEGAAVCVEGVEEVDSPIRYTARIGNRIPLHVGAGPKVLLAFRPEAEIDAYLRGPLQRFTANTLTNPKRVRAELAKIRAQGYATSHGEKDLGVTAISAPIRNHSGSVVATLTLAGPDVHLPAGRVQTLTKVVVETANAVAQELGFTLKSAKQAAAL